MNSYSAADMEEALKQALDESPQSGNVIDAFHDTLMEKQKLKDILLGESRPATTIAPDIENFRKGVSLLNKEGLLPEPDLAMDFAPRIMDALIRGFPNVANGLGIVKRDMLENSEAILPKAQSVISGNTEATEMIANDLGVDTQLLTLCYIRLVKPFAEAKAVSVHQLVKDLEWNQGYCPVCGGWPLIGFLTGEVGKRSLVCGLCEYEWSFPRIGCPFCGNSEQETLEQIFIENREHEKVELCGSCMGYIKTIDLRDRIGPNFPEVLHISTLHLDMTAQERGFSQPAQV